MLSLCPTLPRGACVPGSYFRRRCCHFRARTDRLLDSTIARRRPPGPRRRASSGAHLDQQFAQIAAPEHELQGLGKALDALQDLLGQQQSPRFELAF